MHDPTAMHWLARLAVVLVTLVHAGIAYGLFSAWDRIEPTETAPRVITVSLTAAAPLTPPAGAAMEPFAVPIVEQEVPTPLAMAPSPSSARVATQVLRPKPANRQASKPTASRPVESKATPVADETPVHSLPQPLPVSRPAPRPAAPTEPAVSPPRFSAAYLDNPAPAYPAASRRNGEEGSVRLRVQVSADGRAMNVEIETSSGHERLDDAALRAVRRWRFVPARRGEEPVAASVIVPIAFRLQS